MIFDVQVDFYHVLTGCPYMRSHFQTEHKIGTDKFHQELVNKVGMSGDWMNTTKYYVVVEADARPHGYEVFQRHHFLSISFKGLKREEEK